MNEELHRFIDELDLPQSVKEDLKKEYNSNLPNPDAIRSKKMVKLSSKDGRQAAIILWIDSCVTVVATDANGESHVSSTNSPDMYYIAQKHYIDLGLDVIYIEEDGKKIGVG